MQTQLSELTQRAETASAEPEASREVLSTELMASYEVTQT